VSPPVYYPRPRSLTALGPGHNVVESSAGTGKTFLLEHLFIDLILTRGASAEEILVVTFTEKATAELVLRLRRLLTRLADLPAVSDQVEVAHAPAADVWTIDDQARARLRQALLAFDRANIFTIHAFCQRILREHAFVQGRLFDEELVSEEDSFAAAFHEVLRTKIASHAGLATAIEGWLESGKSIASLKELLCQCNAAGTKTQRPLFDEARLASALRAWQPVASSDELLKQRLKRAGVGSHSIQPVLNRLARVSEIVAACQGDAMRFVVAMQGFPSEPRMGEGLAFVLGRLPDDEQDPTIAALVQTTRALHDNAMPLGAVLTQLLLPWVQQCATGRKRSAGRFDFSDMLNLVAAALADASPAGVALLATLRRRYQFALIDEFQDTDDTQWSIFRRIFVEADDGHALTVIGDPKQSIYGFRGADVHTYLQASQALHEAGGSRLVLDRNFRSSAPMLEATNALFDQQANFFRPASGMTYQPVLCGRDDLALVDTSGVAAPAVVVLRVASQEASPRVTRLRAVLQAAIVEQVRSLLAPASRLRLQSAAGQRRIGARDIFILTFTNVESHAIGQALGSAGIPYAFYKLGDLFASPEAAEILVLLRAIADPDDRNLRAQALLTSFFGLDLADAAVWTDLGLGDGPAQRLLHFAALARRGDIPGLFAAMVDNTGMVRREVFAHAGERALTNVLHVLEIMQAEWVRRHSSLEELADTLDAFIRGTRKPPGQDRDLQRLETDKDAVQILTVHKAKGLEADVVFLYGGTGENRSKAVHVFHDGGQRVLHVGRLNALQKQRVDEDRQDESARLLYVALTRARYRLYLPQYPMFLSGPYRQINRRLEAILDPGPEQGHGPFTIVPVEASLRPEPPVPASPATPTPQLPAPFSALLDDVREPAEVAAIKEQRSGFRVTSYSAIKRAHGGFVAVEDHTDFSARSDADPALGQLSLADDLPGGPETGIFLHALLEKVALPELAAAPSFAHWLARPQVARLVEKTCRRHGRPASHGQPAARLVFGAYTTPIRLGSSIVAGLASVANARREMEFLFPMPEPAHPRLAHTLLARSETAWKVERGVVKGFIDLLFEHDGKIFVCDWKSDHLMQWGRDTLALHCRQNYDVQARIYAMAVARLCGITTHADWERRFGGILFCFLRGLRPDDDSAGIQFRKPAWDEIQAWETDMLGRDFWGSP